MSADIINLRAVRKSRARQAKEQQAQQNRISFGRNKQEKQLSKAEQARLSAKLDAHQRVPGKETDASDPPATSDT